MRTGLSPLWFLLVLYGFACGVSHAQSPQLSGPAQGGASSNVAPQTAPSDVAPPNRETNIAPHAPVGERQVPDLPLLPPSLFPRSPGEGPLPVLPPDEAARADSLAGQGNVFAPLPTHGVANPTRRGKLQPIDFALMKVAALEAAFQIRRSPNALPDLLTAYEDLAGLQCMPDLFQTLQHAPLHSPRPLPEECVGTLGKLEALDPTNSVAACSRYGVDTQQCRDAFAQQSISNYSASGSQGDANQKLGAQKELEAKLDGSRNRVDVSRLGSEYQALLIRRKGSADTEFKTKALPVLYQLLQFTCKVTKTEYPDATARLLQEDAGSKRGAAALTSLSAALSGDAPTPAAPPPPTPRGSGRGLDTVVSAISEKLNTPIESTKKITRVRVLSEECSRWIDTALAADPGYPPAICARESRFSPSCIEALRAYRRKNGMPASGRRVVARPGESGLGTF